MTKVVVLGPKFWKKLAMQLFEGEEEKSEEMRFGERKSMKVFVKLTRRTQRLSFQRGLIEERCRRIP